MRKLISIFTILLFSFNFAFGQIKDLGNTVELRNEIANLKPVFSIQKFDSSTVFSEKTNLFISRSIHQIYEKNNGFKEELNFKSDKNTIQTPFGKMKLNETKSDRIADVLNIIFNK